mmetsp:Transcript_7828/g.33273  ORF Transcript_7828/g.33273 Transcript_7828/m.33273 type:complete len:415 (+) Transcript_7828:1529-2773(+)
MYVVYTNRTGGSHVSAPAPAFVQRRFFPARVVALRLRVVVEVVRDGGARRTTRGGEDLHLPLRLRRLARLVREQVLQVGHGDVFKRRDDGVGALQLVPRLPPEQQHGFGAALRRRLRHRVVVPEHHAPLGGAVHELRGALDGQRVREPIRDVLAGHHVGLALRVSLVGEKLENLELFQRVARGAKGLRAARRRHRDARLFHQSQERKHAGEQFVPGRWSRALLQRLNDLLLEDLLVNLRAALNEPAHLHRVARPPQLPGYEILGLHRRRELEHHLRGGRLLALLREAHPRSSVFRVASLHQSAFQLEHAPEPLRAEHALTLQGIRERGIVGDAHRREVRLLRAAKLARGGDERVRDDDVRRAAAVLHAASDCFTAPVRRETSARREGGWGQITTRPRSAWRAAGARAGARGGAS